MKVLLLCLALTAVALAMPVAENKPDVPAVPEPVAETKSEVKPLADSQPAAPGNKQPEQVPENKENKGPENEVKNAPAEIKPEIPVTETLKAEIKPEKPQDTATSNDAKAADKPEAGQSAETKTENTESKPAVNEKSIPTQPEANVASTKSAILEESIDVVNAVKNPAAVADDVVDPVAIIPIPQKKIDLATNADTKIEPATGDKKDAAPAPAPANAVEKTEGKKEEKPAQAAPASAPAAAADSAVKTADAAAALSEDSTRVVRNTPVDDKAKNAISNNEPLNANEKSSEPAPVAEAPKDVKKAEQPAKGEVVEEKKLTETATKDAQPAAPEPVKSADAVKPIETKPKEKPAADQPKNSSEESNESGEQKDSSEKKEDSVEKDSSEESSEKKETAAKS